MKRVVLVGAGTVASILVSFVMSGTSAASIVGAVGHSNPLGVALSKVEGTITTAVLPSTSTIDSLPTAFLGLGLLAAAAGFALIQRRRAA